MIFFSESCVEIVHITSAYIPLAISWSHSHTKSEEGQAKKVSSCAAMYFAKNRKWDLRIKGGSIE